MSPLARLRQEPYRLLFPLGAACAALGLAMWVTFWLRPEVGYPGTAHTLLMMHGFVTSFVIGFLLTMLPRALGVAIAGDAHLALATVGVLGGCAAAWLGATTLAWAAHLLVLAAPVAFAATRIGRRASPPPPTFVGVAASGAAAIAGSILVLAGGAGTPAWTVALGRALDLHAFPLLMILGIGSFLAPKLAGPAGARVRPDRVAIDVGLALAVLGSFVLEHLPAPDPESRLRLAYALRAAVFAFVVVRRVLPARLHADAPMHLRPIPIALSAMAVGLALPAVWPAQTLTWLHLVSIAGVLWLTLSVAARVLVGHAPRHGAPHAALVVGMGAALVLATLTRIAAGVWPGRTYVLHLAMAALLALAGLALWMVILLPRWWSFPDRR